MTGRIVSSSAVSPELEIAITHVVARDHADVAVARLGRMQEERRRAGARERGGDLVADVAGLAHAGHDDADPVQSCSSRQAATNAASSRSCERGDGRDLGFQDAPSARQQLVWIERGGPEAGLHARIIARRVVPQRRRGARLQLPYRALA